VTGAGRPDGGGRDVVLPVHLALVVLLVVATVILFGFPIGNADCCMPVAALGLVTIGELVIVLVGIAIAGSTGRHSPLAFVDVVITAPLVVVVPSTFGATDASTALVPLVVSALLIVGLASAIVAARVVRGHGIERVVLAGALVLVAAFFLAAPSALVVPLTVLAVLLWPNMPGLGSDPAARRGSPPGGSARVMRRHGPPDAAAILAMRRPGPPRPPDAASPGDDPPTDVAPVDGGPT